MANKSVTAPSEQAPSDHYHADVTGEAIVNCKYVATGAKGDFETDGLMMFDEGMSIIDGVHEALKDEDGQLTANPKILVGMLYGATRLLRMAWAVSEAGSYADAPQRAQA